MSASRPIRDEDKRGHAESIEVADSSLQGMLRYETIPGEIAEAIRSLLNRQELRSGPIPRTIVVASPHEGEGATTVSQSLAAILAQESGKFTCWVDCSWLTADAADPDDERPNLASMLADNNRLGAAFRSAPDLPQLVSLSPGAVPEADRNKIVRSPEFEDLIDLLCEEFDHVVFDVPPLLSNASSLAIVRLADSSLLVTKQRHTSISHVRRALGAMESTRNLGVILNQYRTYIPSGIRRLLGE